MLNNKKYARKPLLYIEQPVNSYPEALMQHDYVTPKSREPKPTHTETTQNKGSRPLKRRYYQPHHPTPIKDESQPSEKDLGNTSIQEQSNKKFTEMDLLEKVDYLLERPDHAPQIRCELRTEQRTYQGVLTGANENSVFIRVGNRKSSTTISKADLVNVRMIGL